MNYLENFAHLVFPVPNNLNFSEDELNLHRDKLEKVTFDVNEFLIQPGQIENYLYFLVEGTLKVAILQGNDPICIDFATRGTMYCSFASLLSRKPSQLVIQSLSRVVAYRMHYDSIHEFDRPTSHYCFSQQLTQAFYNRLLDKELLFAGLNAKGRYERLLSHRRDWVYQIPIKDLASYLGIHPESLSRLRREIYQTDKNSFGNLFIQTSN